jgi:hypothetical protein
MSIRICPDCQNRELDRYEHRCSECAESNRSLSLLIGQHNYLSKKENRLKHNQRALDYHHRTFKPRSYWIELAKN